MDPVNKWLTVIIMFMIALLITINVKGGVGQYAFETRPSTVFSGIDVVYVLDTKSGDVYVKLIDEDELQFNKSPRRRAQKLMEIPSSGYGYNNSRKY